MMPTDGDTQAGTGPESSDPSHGDLRAPKSSPPTRNVPEPSRRTSTSGKTPAANTGRNSIAPVRRISMNVGQSRRRSTRCSPGLSFPRRQSKKQSIVHVLCDGKVSMGVMEESPNDKDVEIKSLGRKKQLATNRIRFVDKEDLKVEVYRNSTGRRQAFDLGKKNRRRAACRQKQAIEAHKARGRKAVHSEKKDFISINSGTKKPNGIKKQSKLSAGDEPAREVTEKTERRPSFINERRGSLLQSGRRRSIIEGPNKERKMTITDYGPRKLLPTRPQMGIDQGGYDAFEVNFHGLALMSRESPKKSMMELMKSIDEKPSNCKILVPKGSAKRINEATKLSNDGISHLTEDHIRAFREVFDLFDSNGGGTIDAGELDLTLRSVDICLSKDEINEVLETIDHDGNGEIDFDEFLLLMTNTERFIENIVSKHKEEDSTVVELPKQTRLFDAFTQFMKKSAIDSMDEIVDYYDTKVKRFQAPHVVNHYAAGARLIGLTEKQLKEHLECLNATNASTGGAKSPYAQPLPLVVSNTSPPVRKRNKGKSNKAMIEQRKKRGIISLKIKLQKQESEDSSSTKAVHDNKSNTPRNEYDPDHGNYNGWVGQRTEHIEVRLSPLHLQKLEPFDELTADDLPFVHAQVNHATREFWRGLRRTQFLENLEHWDMLDTDLITPNILRYHFRDIFSHYTTINRGRLQFNNRLHC